METSRKALEQSGWTSNDEPVSILVLLEPLLLFEHHKNIWIQ
jgi:hypothetical protein